MLILGLYTSYAITATLSTIGSATSGHNSSLCFQNRFMCHCATKFKSKSKYRLRNWYALLLLFCYCCLPMLRSEMYLTEPSRPYSTMDKSSSVILLHSTILLGVPFVGDPVLPAI